jgi:pimeloyl-ACP methyl ester carboxylesterase
MGNQISGAVEHLAHDSIYKPPPVNYLQNSCKFVRTTAGDRIAMRLYSPDAEIEKRFRSCDVVASPYDLLLFSHGNGTDIGFMHRFCEHLRTALAMDVLVYDYPEYGHSSGGKASESSIQAAIEAVFESCMQDAWEPQRTFLMGHSLGSVPTVFLASQATCDVRGVVLLAPLASGSRVFLQNSKYVPRWIQRQLDHVLFDNTHRAAEIRCPVAIVHGTCDTIVPVAHTECLKLVIPESCRYPTLFLSTGHNELVDAGSRDLLTITEYIRKFRTKCLAASAS